MRGAKAMVVAPPAGRLPRVQVTVSPDSQAVLTQSPEKLSSDSWARPTG